MVDFGLTEEQRALRDLAREFARREIAPVAAKHDREHSYPWEVLRKAFDTGLLNGAVPREYGGGGLNVFELPVLESALRVREVRVAEFYEDDVNTKMTASLSLIEPVIMIFMGMFLAFVLVALYLPIFSLADNIR